MTMKSRFGRLWIYAAFAAMGLGLQAQAQDLKPVTVLLPNENTTTLFSAFTARELGFFEDEGLDVTFLSSDTTIPYVAFLSNGQADLIMLDAPQTFQAVNAQQPIAVIYEGMQFAPEGVAVAADSPIQNIGELKGKTVGLASDRDLITLQVALDTAGVTIDEVDTVVVGDTGPVLANAFRNQTVAAVAAAANDWTTVQANGIAVREITPPEVSENPANSFVIYKPRMEELRPVVGPFLRAWAKAVVAGQLDAETVAAICAKSVPEEWENKDAGMLLLQASFKMNFPKTELYGDPQPEIWKNIQGPYVKFGVIAAEIDPASFLDNSFIEEANGFEEAEVRAALDEWKAANADLLK